MVITAYLPFSFSNLSMCFNCNVCILNSVSCNRRPSDSKANEPEVWRGTRAKLKIGAVGTAPPKTPGPRAENGQSVEKTPNKSYRRPSVQIRIRSVFRSKLEKEKKRINKPILSRSQHNSFSDQHQVSSRIKEEIFRKDIEIIPKRDRRYAKTERAMGEVNSQETHMVVASLVSLASS